MKESNINEETQPEQLRVTVKKIKGLTHKQAEHIARLSIRAIAESNSLSDVCEYISTTLNARSNNQHWICMASTDPNMCGYLFKCKGYTQFALSNYYFLVASTSV